jgi:hypothetical protein
MQGDLTTLARVQTWLNEPTPSTVSQAALATLISSCSATVLNYLGRQGLAVTTSQTVYDTWGNDFVMLRGGPIISISNVEICGGSILPANATTWPPTTGYDLEPLDPSGCNQQRLTLYGQCFPYGRRTLRVTAQSGFLNTETLTVGAGLTFQTNWTSLGHVMATYVATGQPLTNIPFGQTPIVGQFTENGSGLYTFAAGDIGQQITVGYSFVPADIDNAVVQCVGEDYRRRSRIGMRSQSTGGQVTVSYDMSDMPMNVKLKLAPFRTVTPA